MTETSTLQGENIQITIPLPPITKKNHQQICWKNSAGGKKIPFVRPSAQYNQYEKDCAVFLKSLGIDQPVNIAAKFYMPTKRRVDLTNLNEALHDILVKYGVLADDNAKIIVSTDGSRVFCDKTSPRTEIVITATEFDAISAQTEHVGRIMLPHTNPRIMISARNPVYDSRKVELYLKSLIIIYQIEHLLTSSTLNKNA